MNTPIRFICFTTALLLILFAWVHAGEVTIPNTFESGTPAVAAEVNENFATLQAVVIELQATIVSLQGRLETLETSEVMALDDYLMLDETGDPRGTLVQLSGVNLQIVNGLDSTDTINGLGNLIIGYDEEESGDSDKIGSHYLVTGSKNHYTRYGGMVAGYRNTASGNYSTVTGGGTNTAHGNFSSISGGGENSAIGTYSSVSGGGGNTANAHISTVSGGIENTANFHYSSVSGGRNRTAVDHYDWVAGSLIEDF